MLSAEMKKEIKRVVVEYVESHPSENYSLTLRDYSSKGHIAHLVYRLAYICGQNNITILDKIPDVSACAGTDFTPETDNKSINTVKILENLMDIAEKAGILDRGHSEDSILAPEPAGEPKKYAAVLKWWAMRFAAAIVFPITAILGGATYLYRAVLDYQAAKKLKVDEVVVVDVLRPPINAEAVDVVTTKPEDDIRFLKPLLKWRSVKDYVGHCASWGTEVDRAKQYTRPKI